MTNAKRKNNGGGILFDYRGNPHLVPWFDGDGLEHLRRLLGCQWVEAVRLCGPLAGLSMWCDEEGKLSDHVANIPASLVYRFICGGDYMAGRVLILRDDGGRSVPLTRFDVLNVQRVTVAALRFAEERRIVIDATGPHCELIEM